MMLPRAVFFDLDNTLVHRDASIDLYARRFWRDFGDAIDGGGEAHVAELVKCCDNGGYLPAGSPFTSIKQAVSHGLKTQIVWRQAVEQDALLDHWERHNAVCTAAMPGAAEAVGFLAANGVRVGVISNGSHRTRLEKVAQLPFAAAIELTVSSESAGVKKPDAAIFRLAAAALGVAPVWLSGFHAWPADAAPPPRQLASLAQLADFSAR